MYFNHKVLYFKLIYILLLCFITLVCEAQTYNLKGKLLAGSNAIAGASVMLNGKYVTQSGMDGNFYTVAKVGDTLKIKSPFYQDYSKILNDTSKQILTIRQKEFQLDEVNISFNKRKVIDSTLLSAFSKLSKNPYFGKAFLRQSITKNNSRIILSNEGILNLITPSNKEMTVRDDDYKKIGINIQSSCILTPLTEKKLIFSSNPQIKLRRGLAPEYYYKIIKNNTVNEFIKDDGEKIMITITAHLPKLDTKLNYIYIINKDSNSLRQIQLYEEEKNGDYFFMNFEYQNNNVISIYSSAKQNRLHDFYSTADEIFLNRGTGAFNYPINFNPDKCGLHSYLKETNNCEAVNEYKRSKNIPDQKYF